MSFLKVEGVSFAYRKEQALNQVSLELKQGDFAAFIGPNGSGKSTLLKLILGYLKPTRGRIMLKGQPVEDIMDWSRVGYISQQVKDFNQSFPATVREIVGSNLYSKMGMIKFLNQELEKKICRSLELVEMDGFINRKIGNLSSGQQQRIFIARLMVNDPELILLDEPLAGIDIRAQDDFYRIIANINQELNKTVIMVSHDIQVISKHANKIVCFEDGRAYPHCSQEFSYDDYIHELRRTNLRIIPRHDH